MEITAWNNISYRSCQTNITQYQKPSSCESLTFRQQKKCWNVDWFVGIVGFLNRVATMTKLTWRLTVTATFVLLSVTACLFYWNSHPVTYLNLLFAFVRKRHVSSPQRFYRYVFLGVKEEKDIMIIWPRSNPSSIFRTSTNEGFLLCTYSTDSKRLYSTSSHICDASKYIMNNFMLMVI